MSLASRAPGPRLDTPAAAAAAATAGEGFAIAFRRRGGDSRAMRIVPFVFSAAVLAGLVFPHGVSAADEAFAAWLQSLWPQAQQLGVSRATFDAATRGLEPDLSLPELAIPGRPQQTAPGQPEFVETPADYLKETTFDRLAAQGRKLFDQYRAPLTAIERQFGVAPTVLLAIFGRETDYGRSRDSRDAIRVLATQAYFGKRKDKFQGEFLLALKMLEDGYVKRADMKSSWAGAMGLTQFLPSDFYKYAVDFDGNGRPDIWNSVPDALASAAKQLLDKGWQRGLRWAYEVRAPADVDCAIGVPENTQPIGEWLKRGFVPAYERNLSPAERLEPASLLQPAGLYGPAFLATKNYFAIKEYNFSDLYVLFVGHLSDRMLDPRPFEMPWTKVAQLSTRDLDRMQEILTARGYYHDKIDGKAGMKTRAALGEYQKRNGLKVDCWPTAALLAHMQAAGH
jgi:lytic murein transglycosylase